MAINRELNYSGESPLLYLIATPIGNLSEFSPRAIQIISEMDFVASEDTRNTAKLLSFFSISKPLISCHEHNEEEASEKIVALLKEGKKVAYVSDAGYPCISDPGERLVRKCLQNSIKISTVNGPNAALCALAASGFDASHFYFYGFLPSKQSERIKELTKIEPREETTILYESPHRIDKTIKDLYTVLGNRNICIARELTKAHEEFIRCTLEEATHLDQSTLLGEMVLVLEGKKETKEVVSEERIIESLKSHLKNERSKEAISNCSKELGVKKNLVYEIYLKIKEN